VFCDRDEALAQFGDFAYISFVGGRPCKADADLKWLWRTLLRSTPMPACGVPDKSEAAAAADDRIKPIAVLRDDAEPQT
jgi:hypothetical protein